MARVDPEVGHGVLAINSEIVALLLRLPAARPLQGRWRRHRVPGNEYGERAHSCTWGSCRDRRRGEAAVPSASQPSGTAEP